MKRLAGEPIDRAFLEKEMVTVNHPAAGRRIVARLLEAVIALLQLTRRVDRWVEWTRQLHPPVRRSEVRIAPQVMVRQDVVPKGPGILRAEPATPVVPVPPELRRTTLRLHHPGVRMEAKIATPHPYLALVARGTDHGG